MTEADINAAARICYEAFNAIAARHNFPSDFPSVRHAHDLVGALHPHPGYFSVVAESDGRVARGAAKVVERDGQITGYTTDVGFTGHSVAVSNEDLEALIADAEKFSWNGFLVPLRNAELLRWCFDHGLRVVYLLNMMALGHYQEPRGSFLASIGY
ncbi:hypothetical protein SKC41_21205 [Mycobacterium sp. 050128]|uniref:hypothetical protein n=1 Tax=Mycobacterium sp. 050128 TaxID=3096112 RepID=UPI002EDB49F5